MFMKGLFMKGFMMILRRIFAQKNLYVLTITVIKVSIARTKETKKSEQVRLQCCTQRYVIPAPAWGIMAL